MEEDMVINKLAHRDYLIFGVTKYGGKMTISLTLRLAHNLSIECFLTIEAYAEEFTILFVWTFVNLEVCMQIDSL